MHHVYPPCYSLSAHKVKYRLIIGEMMIHFAVGESDLGMVAVAASLQGVCAIVLGEDRGLLIDELQHYRTYAPVLQP